VTYQKYGWRNAITTVRCGLKRFHSTDGGTYMYTMNYCLTTLLFVFELNIQCRECHGERPTLGTFFLLDPPKLPIWPPCESTRNMLKTRIEWTCRVLGVETRTRLFLTSVSTGPPVSQGIRAPVNFYPEWKRVCANDHNITYYSAAVTSSLLNGYLIWAFFSFLSEQSSFSSATIFRHNLSLLFLGLAAVERNTLFAS